MLRESAAAARLYLINRRRIYPLAESSLLAGLPQSPTRLNPYLHFKQARERQLAISHQMRNQRSITQEAYEVAKEQRLTLVPKEKNFFAPHFCDCSWSNREKNWSPKNTHTLDLPLQKDFRSLGFHLCEAFKK